MVGGGSIQRKEPLYLVRAKKMWWQLRSSTPRLIRIDLHHVVHGGQKLQSSMPNMANSLLTLMRWGFGNFASKRSKIYTSGGEAASYENAGKSEKEANTVFKNGVPNGRLDEHANRFPQGERDAVRTKKTTKMHDNLDRDFTVRRGCETQNNQNVVTYREPNFMTLIRTAESSFRLDQIRSLYDDQEGIARR